MSMLTRRREMMIEESWLPEGCVELEYLECTGTQYIDTGIVHTLDDIITSELSKTFTASNAAFGRRDSRGLPSTVVFSDSAVFFKHSNDGAAGSVPTESIQHNSVTEYTLDRNGLNVSGVGFFKHPTTPKSAIEDWTYFIGAENNAGFTVKHFRGRIHSLSINNICKFIPVLDPSGKPCMYDTVGMQYYYNQGTGEFLYKIK